MTQDWLALFVRNSDQARMDIQPVGVMESMVGLSITCVVPGLSRLLEAGASPAVPEWFVELWYTEYTQPDAQFGLAW